MTNHWRRLRSVEWQYDIDW